MKHKHKWDLYECYGLQKVDTVTMSSKFSIYAPKKVVYVCECGKFKVVEIKK